MRSTLLKPTWLLLATITLKSPGPASLPSLEAPHTSQRIKINGFHGGGAPGKVER